ncbi:MAG: ThiF family adenylyltransferase [Bacillota bacterium]
MNYSLRLPIHLYQEMLKDLHRIHGVEQAVFGLAGEISSGLDKTFLLRDLYLVPEDQYISHGPSHFEVKEGFVSMVIKGALIDTASIVMAHIHPLSSGDANFSGIDDGYEPKLLQYIQQALPEAHFICMVHHPNGTWAARVYPPDRSRPAPIENLTVMGRPTRNLLPTNSPARNSPMDMVPEVFERQARALGRESYRILRRLKVGIIGLGGTGSVVNQQLAHLGVGTIVQVDPDTIEESNLSRLVGAGSRDLGKPKVDVAKRVAANTAGGTHCIPIPCELDKPEAFTELKTCDVLFCCTDNVSSRRLANRLAVQYQIPLFDLGVSLKSDNGMLRYGNGEFRPVLPGGPCLECMGVIDQDTLIQEVQGLAGTGYLNGEREPAVISFNSLMASLAVTEFLSVFTGFTNYENDRATIHSILEGLIFDASKALDPDCDCQSWQGMGDKLDFPLRQ